MRVATFNVLADAYTGYGDLSHVDPALLDQGARTDATVDLIDSLGVDLVALQEAELPLVQALSDKGSWQLLRQPKGLSKPDGCLTLVRKGIEVDGNESVAFSDRSGHVAQITHIGDVAFANSHIKWSPEDDPHHKGVYQMKELLGALGLRSAVILADCNDRPGGPVRRQVEQAGFTDLGRDIPTAYVDHAQVAIDLLAVRGVSAKLIPTKLKPINIPDAQCPSDHIPLVAELQL